MTSHTIFHRLLLITFLMIITSPVVAQQLDDPWEQTMQQFEELDRTNASF